MKKLIESIKKRRENTTAVASSMLKIFIPTLVTLALISLGALVAYAFSEAEYALTLARDCALCLKGCFGVSLLSLVVAHYSCKG